MVIWLVEDIQRHLPPARKLVEPFARCRLRYFLKILILNGTQRGYQSDLINLYNLLKTDPETYISEAKRWFCPEIIAEIIFRYSSWVQWYRQCHVSLLAFLYMNRFGFNGLCRYNKKGGFNVPFGSYKTLLPRSWTEFFSEKSEKSDVCCKEATTKPLAAPVKAVWVLLWSSLCATVCFLNFALLRG